LGIPKLKAYISLTMKNLIIHPKDHTTQFLSPIYAPLKNKTVIDGGVRKSELRELIDVNERVIMLGHGSPYGLLSVGQFPDVGFHIVDVSIVNLLMGKPDNIYIWCHADQFVKRNGLTGLCSGMFVSEVEESICYGFDEIERDSIDESNNGFSSIVSKYINERMDVLYRNLMDEYGKLSQTNLIARFMRLYSQGESKLKISDLTGVSRNTLKKYLKIYIRQGLTLPDIERLSDQELDHLFGENDS
jgi:hypothetical protein